METQMLSQGVLESSRRSSEAAVAGSGQTVLSLWAQWKRFELNQGLLYRHWDNVHITGIITRQLFVPRSLVLEVLNALHSGAGEAHLAWPKTIFRNRFYWPELRDDMEDWCICYQSVLKASLLSQLDLHPSTSAELVFP